jgi:predicted amidohydrolase YtcJ
MLICWPAGASLIFGQAPDIIYLNGKIITVAADHSVVKAVAIRTERIKLEGRCAVPGLIDGHVHPIMADLSEQDGPIPVFRSIPEIQAYIRQQAAKLPADRLIFVPKVYASRLKERRYPTRQEIDAASGPHEAVVDNGCASVLNTAVMRHLGINKDTPQPGAGRIEKDANGEPTGLILGAPQLLAHVRTVRPVTPADRLWALREMLHHYSRVGMRNTQIYGYSDANFRGVLTVPRENVFLMAQLADELGWQMTAHATGGGALDLLLDPYEAADRVKPIAGRRFTATHANFPNARAIERARKQGIAFDVQPAWLHFDGAAIRDVLGRERMKDFLPLRSLLDAGIIVGGGSDQMIRFDARLATNPYHPFDGMWMAITRETKEGVVIHPEQRVTREQALKMWAWNNAYIMFAEKEIGSIEPGKRADMVVITKDFLTCPEREIKDIEALRTIVGGAKSFMTSYNESDSI